MKTSTCPRGQNALGSDQFAISLDWLMQRLNELPCVAGLKNLVQVLKQVIAQTQGLGQGQIENVLLMQ